MATTAVADWRPDVAMPASVAALPRSWAGVPVGFTTLWDSEIDVTVRPEPLLGGTPAIFHRGAQGEGEPWIRMPNAARTRESVLNGLCQVCAADLGPRPWLVADLRIDTQTLRIDGRYVPVLVDAWTCEPCLAYSLLTCPGLSRLQPAILRVWEWLPVPTPERPKYLLADVLPYGPVGFVKIAPTRYEVRP